MKQWWTNNLSAQTASSHHSVLAPNFYFYPFQLLSVCDVSDWKSGFVQIDMVQLNWNFYVKFNSFIEEYKFWNADSGMRTQMCSLPPSWRRSNRRRWRESSAIIRTELKKYSKMSSSSPAIRTDTCDATVRKYPGWIWQSGHTVAKVNCPKMRNLLMQSWHFELSLIFKLSAEQSSISSSCLHNSG